MTNDRAPSEQALYWNEDGGLRWVRNIDAVETMLDGLGQRLLATLDAGPGQRVLDIGCGGGATSAALAGAVGNSGSVLGLDVSAPILAVARARHADLSNLHFLVADASYEPLPEPKFDLLTSRFGVMFFHEPAAAFRNLHRAAAPAARLVFMCWRRFDENPWMATAAKAAFEVLGAPPKPAPGTPGPFSFADSERVATILSEAGFAAVHVTAVDLPLNLGDLATAVHRLTQIGAAAQPLREAAPAAREQALEAMRVALEPHVTPAGVVLASATWIVEARASA